MTSCCCSNQCVLSGSFKGSRCRSRFSKKKYYFRLPFEITSIYFCSASTCPSPRLSHCSDFLFISFPDVLHHCLVSYRCISRDTSVSHICRSELNLPKVTCRYNIPILPVTLTEMKCLSWACASSQRSPPPSSRPPLSLHCFPFALTLLSCSH